MSEALISRSFSTLQSLMAGGNIGWTTNIEMDDVDDGPWFNIGNIPYTPEVMIVSDGSDGLKLLFQNDEATMYSYFSETWGRGAIIWKIRINGCYIEAQQDWRNTIDVAGKRLPIGSRKYICF